MTNTKLFCKLWSLWGKNNINNRMLYNHKNLIYHKKSIQKLLIVTPVCPFHKLEDLEVWPLYHNPLTLYNTIQSKFAIRNLWNIVLFFLNRHLYKWQLRLNHIVWQRRRYISTIETRSLLPRQALGRYNDTITCGGFMTPQVKYRQNL